MEAESNNSLDATDKRQKELESLVSALAEEVEDLRQQLSLALESKRLLNARVEDMAFEIQSAKARHAQTVGDLHTQLSIVNRLPISKARRARRIACWRSYTRLRSSGTYSKMNPIASACIWKLSLKTRCCSMLLFVTGITEHHQAITTQLTI